MKAVMIILIAMLTTALAQDFNTTSAIPTTASKIQEDFKEFNFEAHENKEICTLLTRKHKQMYLRGATWPHSISYNKTTMAECARLCCDMKESLTFQCKSFSLFKSLNQCFLMNITRQNSFAYLVPSNGYVHYEVLVDQETTTAISKTTETFDESTSNEQVTSATDIGVVDEEITTDYWVDTTGTDSFKNPETTDNVMIEETTDTPADGSNDLLSKLTTRSDSTTSKTTITTTTMPTTTTTTTTTKTTKTTTTTTEPTTSATTTTGAATTSATTTAAPTTATEKSGVAGSTENSDIFGNDKGILVEDQVGLGKLVGDKCDLLDNCGPNGDCYTKDTEDGQTEPYCKCHEGFNGDKCETKVTERDGFPIWIIIVIVIAALIVILIIVACILLQVYKRKKGEYKVVDYFRRWARRDKKPEKPDNDDEIAHMDDDYDNTSSSASMHSIQNQSTRTAV